MIVLSGADLVLPDRILSPGTLVVENGRIAEIRSGAAASGFAFQSHYIVPGFVDVHVHGVEGVDTLDPVENIDGVNDNEDNEGVDAIRASPNAFRATAFRPSVRPRSRVRPVRSETCSPRSGARARWRPPGRPAFFRRTSRATSSTRCTEARSRSLAFECLQGRVGRAGRVGQVGKRRLGSAPQTSCA